LKKRLRENSRNRLLVLTRSCTMHTCVFLYLYPPRSDHATSRENHP
jgi:hypothetical protein